MQIPSIGSGPLGGALAFKQNMQMQELNIAVAKKSIDMAKGVGQDLLTLLGPDHLGKNLDIKA